MTFRHRVIFWGLILGLLTVLFGQGPGGFSESFYFVCMLLPVAIGTSWYFNEYLVPYYLLPKRYRKFGLYVIYSMIISLWAQMIVIFLAYILLANYKLENMAPMTTNVRLLALAIYGIVFLEAFVNMYKKFQDASHTASALAEEKEKSKKGHIMVRSDRKLSRIDYDDILYIESLSDYVRFVMSENEPLTTRATISHVQDQLPDDFIRIHRSFIVNKPAINFFTKEEVQIGPYSLPVGRKYKNEFVERMKN